VQGYELEFSAVTAHYSQTAGCIEYDIVEILGYAKAALVQGQMLRGCEANIVALRSVGEEEKLWGRMIEHDHQV
jgi:hypothetical protein